MEEDEGSWSASDFSTAHDAAGPEEDAVDADEEAVPAAVAVATCGGVEDEDDDDDMQGKSGKGGKSSA